jgi:hypothetical protein
MKHNRLRLAAQPEENTHRPATPAPEKPRATEYDTTMMTTMDDSDLIKIRRPKTAFWNGLMHARRSPALFRPPLDYWPKP